MEIRKRSLFSITVWSIQREVLSQRMAGSHKYLESRTITNSPSQIQWLVYIRTFHCCFCKEAQPLFHYRNPGCPLAPYTTLKHMSQDYITRRVTLSIGCKSQDYITHRVTLSIGCKLLDYNTELPSLWSTGVWARKSLMTHPRKRRLTYNSCS